MGSFAAARRARRPRSRRVQICRRLHSDLHVGAALATPPQVELKAVNPTAVTEGPAWAIAATSIGGSRALLDGTNGDGRRDAYFAGASFVNNVYLLKVVITSRGTTFEAAGSPTTPGAARDFVWVVGSSGTESQKAWIHASPARSPTPR